MHTKESFKRKFLSKEEYSNRLNMKKYSSFLLINKNNKNVIGHVGFKLNNLNKEIDGKIAFNLVHLLRQNIEELNI